MNIAMNIEVMDTETPNQDTLITNDLKGLRATIKITEKVMLTERELQVLKLVAEGNCNKEIAQAADMAGRTVAWYIEKLLIKTNEGHRGRSGLIIFAYDVGLVKPNREVRA
jgi:DNA-binding NarL/FixJ family response regulator